MGNKGKATVKLEDRFRAADIKIPIYIYNVSKEVQSSDIVKYIKDKTNIDVTVEKNTMKINKDYDDTLATSVIDDLAVTANAHKRNKHSLPELWEKSDQTQKNAR